MDSEVRRTFEMTGGVVRFSDANADPDPGHATSVTRLKEVKAAMDVAAGVQRAGLIDRHTAAMEKRRLRREMLAGPIAHLSEVGRLAAQKHPELVGKLRYKPSGTSYVSHLTAARSLLEAAQTHTAELAEFGLSAAVLEAFEQLLEQFEAAVQLGSDARAAHTGATKRLTALGQEAGRIVRAMDARNQIRFKQDPQLLGAWITASTVVARPVASGAGETPAGGSTPTGSQENGSAQGGTPVAGGDVRPAA
jgi:hypothetical protein